MITQQRLIVQAWAQGKKRTFAWMCFVSFLSQCWALKENDLIGRKEAQIVFIF